MHPHHRMAQAKEAVHQPINRLVQLSVLRPLDLMHPHHRLTQAREAVHQPINRLEAVEPLYEQVRVDVGHAVLLLYGHRRRICESVMYISIFYRIYAVK